MLFMLVTGLAKSSRRRQAPSARLSWQPGLDARRAELARGPRVPSIPPPWLSERQPCHGKELVEPPPTTTFRGQPTAALKALVAGGRFAERGSEKGLEPQLRVSDRHGSGSDFYSKASKG